MKQVEKRVPQSPIVRRFRQVEGLSVETVPLTHLTDDAKEQIQAVQFSRAVRTPSGFLAWYFPFFPVHSTPGVEAAGGLTSLGIAVLSHKVMQKQVDHLAEMHANGNLIRAAKSGQWDERLKRLKPTHLSIDRQGNVVFIRETRRNALAKLMAQNPVKTYRAVIRSMD